MEQQQDSQGNEYFMLNSQALAKEMGKGQDDHGSTTMWRTQEVSSFSEGTDNGISLHQAYETW